ncbi:MAG: alkaline phosphatase family protein [Ignavibacteriales bacterium]|nr:alkaline phosphatase family protein [Ignavibacteriales bacterium]
MKQTKIFALAVLVLPLLLTTLDAQELKRPKLVIGIVVDQMRYDYLYKYYPFYCGGGFKKLMNVGSNFTFAHYNYEATKTAPGHASIYTGATPFYHGIIGNDWYDKQTRQVVNAVVDTRYKSVGSNDKEGECSPKKLRATTITDQLKMAFNGKSKVISISSKNRGAVLPGGHLPSGVYWYNNNNGDFITSSYYMKHLPEWVEGFNKRKLADKYIEAGWHLFMKKENYAISEPDETNHEEDVFNEGRTSFPHTFRNVKPGEKYSLFPNTPFSNDLVYEFAKQALINEELGKDEIPDFLAVSFSAPDYIGHSYGTNAYETQDVYVRLDSTLSDFIIMLDKLIGKENYILFLTADHAALDSPSFLEENNLPTGGLGNKIQMVKEFLLDTFGSDNLIENVSNKQIYFDRDVIKKNKIDIHILQQKTADFLRDSFPEIAAIITRDNLEGKTAAREPVNPILNSFPLSIAGDVFFTLRPGYLSEFREKGTNHGSEYSYDTHVPLLFYGWNIPKQTVNAPVFIVDIAPTIADLLKISEPSASIGIPLIKND